MPKKTKRTKQKKNTSSNFDFINRQLSYARYLLEREEYEEMISICEPLRNRIAKHSPSYSQLLLLLGLAHLMLEHFQESYDIFTEGIELDPTKTEFWFNRGESAYHMKRIGRAVRDFDRMIELMGTHKLSGEMAQDIREIREEFQLLLQEIALTPEQYFEWEDNFLAGVRAMKQSKWHEAEQLFKQIATIDPNIPSYWTNLGTALVMQNKYDEAEEAFQRALQLDPGYVLARRNLENLPALQGGEKKPDIKTVGEAELQEMQHPTSSNDKNSVDQSSASQTTFKNASGAAMNTRTRLGKLEPRYMFFLNPYLDARFTVCPLCGEKMKLRKFTLLVHVDPAYAYVTTMQCRYCPINDLFIVHKNLLEERMAAYYSKFYPDAVGNDYLVLGTLKWSEWEQKDDTFSLEEVIEHLHDFKEVVIFK